jgi:hypothetical protein
LDYAVEKRGTEYSRVLADTNERLTCSEAGGFMKWKISSESGSKILIIEDSHACREWVSQYVSLDRKLDIEDHELAFIERVVRMIFAQYDDWRGSTENFARWALHFYPQLVTWQAPPD